MGSAKTKRQLSRHARGYTNAQVARRRRLEPLVASGQVACCRCRELIQPRQQWHLDHTDDRRGYLGAAHATCNLRAAVSKRNGVRESKTLYWSRVWFEPIPRTSFSAAMQTEPTLNPSPALEFPCFRGHLSAGSAVSDLAGRMRHHAKGIELQEAVPA
jgi:hypothetical protein